jgi:hypothetical protein
MSNSEPEAFQGPKSMVSISAGAGAAGSTGWEGPGQNLEEGGEIQITGQSVGCLDGDGGRRHRRHPKPGHRHRDLPERRIADVDVRLLRRARSRPDPREDQRETERSQPGHGFLLPNGFSSVRTA